MYISSRHKQQFLANCDHDISISDIIIQVSSVEKLLGVTISNILCWDADIDHLIKKCNSYLFVLSGIKVFLSTRNRILFYNCYNLPHLDFCCIIWGNCNSTLEDIVKYQKKAARVILDCVFIHHPQNYLKHSIGKHSQKELHIKYRIINNICPHYLKQTMSHILLTYQVELTNCIRQNLTADFSASHSCTQVLSSGMLSPHMLKKQLGLTLLNLYI